MDAVRFLVAAIIWFTILVLNFSFIISKSWPENSVFQTDFETLVIANLSFLMFGILKE